MYDTPKLLKIQILILDIGRFLEEPKTYSMLSLLACIVILTFLISLKVLSLNNQSIQEPLSHQSTVESGVLSTSILLILRNRFIFKIMPEPAIRKCCQPDFQVLRDHQSQTSVSSSTQNLSSSSSSFSIPQENQPEPEKTRSWSNFVDSGLLSEDWQAEEDDDSYYKSQILNGFGLEHVPQTPILWQHSTDTLAVLCTTGVYGFGIDFECGFLISDTVEGAIQYMTVYGIRQQGPTRRAHGFYDVTANDIFGNKFGDDLSNSDGYYDSGFEDCSDDNE